MKNKTINSGDGVLQQKESNYTKLYYKQIHM